MIPTIHDPQGLRYLAVGPWLPWASKESLTRIVMITGDDLPYKDSIILANEFRNEDTSVISLGIGVNYKLHQIDEALTQYAKMIADQADNGNIVHVAKQCHCEQCDDIKIKALVQLVAISTTHGMQWILVSYAPNRLKDYSYPSNQQCGPYSDKNEAIKESENLVVTLNNLGYDTTTDVLNLIGEQETSCVV